MSNVIVTLDSGSGDIAKVAVALLDESTILAKTVSRDYEADFGGGTGALIRVRRPSMLTANTRAVGATSAVTVSDLNESSLNVQLSEQVYSAVVLTDADLTLNLESFGSQVLMPQVDSVAAAIEDRVAALLESITQDATMTAAYSSADPLASFIAARQALAGMGVPLSNGNVYAAVGDSVMTDLLSTGALRDASQAGDAATLRLGSPGKVYGFTVVESSRLAADEAVFYHRSAGTLAVRAPKVPVGVSGSSQASKAGALTHLVDYDASTLTQRSVVSAFVGTALIDHPSRVTGSNVIPAVRIGGAA